MCVPFQKTDGMSFIKIIMLANIRVSVFPPQATPARIAFCQNQMDIQERQFSLSLERDYG